MRVIPGRPVLCHLECVRLRFSWRDGAFSHSIGAVLNVGTHLTQAVPVNRGPIEPKTIGDCYFDGITPISGQGWPRELIVDKLSADKSQYLPRTVKAPFRCGES